MKVLVTGAAGQLGREIVLLMRSLSIDVVGIGRKELDFSNPGRVTEWIAEQRFDRVINCAAYTRVDLAEEEPEKAFLINRDAVRGVAEGVRAYGGRLLHISTDYIFDGMQSRPYAETDQANPLGVYGRSKLEGEKAVTEILPDSVVLRTSWVYGTYGNNFVLTILRLAGEHEELRIVDDQIGSPTWTSDIANAIWTLMNADASGIYHFTNEGIASWYDFAVEIVRLAQGMGYPIKTRRILPIPSSDYQTQAARPHYSVLNKQKARLILGYDIPHWADSLGRMLQQVQSAN